MARFDRRSLKSRPFSLASDFRGDDEPGAYRLVKAGVNTLKFARDKSPAETQ
jgi:hypothetical protein